MTDETSNNYKCSECGSEGPTLSSEGTEALDHMVSEHGFDPESDARSAHPYLIPVP